MIRHIVIVYLQRGMHDNYPVLLSGIAPLLDQIPGIISFQIRPNYSTYVPADVYSVGFEIYFEDQEALDGFMHHPKHFEANDIFERYLADPPFMVLTHPIAGSELA